MADKKVIAVLGATGAQVKGEAEARDLRKARALNPAMQTLDQWLAQNAGRIPLA